MFKRIVRKDGSVIVLLPQKETKAATFEVLYKVGSRQETPKINGASHFVEHLMFKGTSKRPNTQIIARELDSIGAEYNAFTGKDHTGYYITADASHLALSIEMLGDMLHNSLFDKTEVDRERGVIVEEINMYRDNPLMYIEDLLEEVAYKGSSLAMDIAGPRKVIKSVSRDELFKYHKKYYYNGNAVFGVAGKFDEAKVLKLINKHFPVETKKPRAKIKSVKTIPQTSPRAMIVNRELEQVQLMLGFRCMSSLDPRFLINRVIANIFGGTMSSRLFIEIRERRGLCYGIRASMYGYEDISTFRIQSGLNKAKIYEALEAIKEELNKLKTEGITDEELVRAKDNIRGRLILSLENSSTHLNYLIGQEILGKKIEDMEDVLKKLDKVSKKQINEMAKKMIDWKKSNLVIIGPFKDKNKFLSILKK